ncbi:hypothetical protein [Spirosoma aerophilum]
MTKRLFICCCLLTGSAFAQAPTKTVRRDSIPVNGPIPMPTARQSNSFYRNPGDPPTIVRATVDNMPVKVPDTSMNYTMLRLNEQPLRLNQPPTLVVPPSFKISPK